jgi:hypothetical protein
MAHKLPLYVRQHYNAKPTISKDGWFLRCDHCTKTFNLLKPPPGMPVEENGLRMLRRHTQTHTAPKDSPNAYRVVGYDLGDLVVAPTILDGGEKPDMVHVLGNNYYMVAVYAANVKHARLKAHGLIKAYLEIPSQRRHWRHNPR